MNTNRARGTFEVTLSPLPHSADDATLGRMSIVKVLHGDLEATGRGEMLSAGGDVQGSAGYVAIERITGALHGRAGSFALQHRGVMNRGAAELLVTVVPDSGTGALAGLAGTLAIQIVDGVHRYDFDYTLP
jgi:hypothetical protein